MASLMMMGVLLVALPAFFAFAASAEPQIPSVAFFTPGQGTFELLPDVRIVVDAEHGLEGSPSAYTFAETFRSDLMSVTGYDYVVPVEVADYGAGTLFAPVIYVFIDPTLNYTLYNGRHTPEGYDFEITEYTYTIKASAPLGAWWGTRTLLQQVALTVGSGSRAITLPVGMGSDSPGWEIRGFMVDAGRHWFDSTFLADLCIYASFFKINEFHVHASDNLWNPGYLYGSGDSWTELYAAFRFQAPPGSPLEGLDKRLNESWTQDEFLAMQTTCTNHGVMIIPEIDTPGHSLVVTQWRPELMLSGSPDMLNLSYPDTIPTIQTIWKEFLPWFTSPEVSIGADEYVASLGDEYTAFVNQMSDYIYEESGKSIRIWGTLEPSTTPVSRNITIQHWDFPDEDIPVRLMENGYYIINSEQYFLYLDGKTSSYGQFPQTLDLTLMFSGAPGGAGWAPNIFSSTDPTNNTSVDNVMLRGSIMALWSDWGNNATTMLEDYYQLAESLAVFGEKTWAGSGVRDTELTLDEFNGAYPILNAAAPGQNLNRVVKPAYGNVVYEYPGEYNTFVTPIGSVGPPYTFTFSVKPSATHADAGLLFSGTDSRLWVANLTFEATGQLYALGYMLPTDAYTSVAIHATQEYTYAIIDDDEEHPYFWVTVMDIWEEYMAVGNMSFAAPAQFFGGEGFAGTVKNISLTVGS